jgi:hypothetical protein
MVTRPFNNKLIRGQKFLNTSNKYIGFKFDWSLKQPSGSHAFSRVFLWQIKGGFFKIDDLEWHFKIFRK